MSSGLPARPIVHGDETPASILMRAAEKVGFSHLREFAYAHVNQDLTWIKAAYIRPARCSPLLKHLGINISQEWTDQQASYSGPTTGTPLRFGQRHYPRAMLRSDATVFCPQCLREASYWRQDWLLRPYGVCLKHGNYCYDRCQNCHHPLNPWRARLEHCQYCDDRLQDQAILMAEDLEPLRWWTKLHDSATSAAAVADALFLGVSKVDGGRTDPRSEHDRLTVVWNWMVQQRIDDGLKAMVQAKALVLNPRIQLLPLLKSKNWEVRNLAEYLLEKIEPVPLDPSRPRSPKTLGELEACAALGVSTAQLRRFFATGVFTPVDAEGGKRRQIDLETVNEILTTFQLPLSVSRNIKRSPKPVRPSTRSVANLVRFVMDGGEIDAGFQISKGLKSIVGLAGLAKSKPGLIHDPEWMTLGQVASHLGTYPEAARRLMTKGWIPRRERDLEGVKRAISRRRDVEAFEREYVLVGTWAEQIGVNRRNLVERLKLLGTEPVSGPDIDGMLVPVYRRADLALIDLEKIRNMGHQQARTGRGADPVVFTEIKEGDSVTAAVAADLLGLTVQDIHRLVHQGVLKSPEHAVSVRVQVTVVSIQELRTQLQRSDIVPFERASIALGIPASELDTIWAASDTIKIINLGLWRFITLKDFDKLKAIQAECLTARQAGKLFGMHRSHLPNLERQGRITSTTLGSRRRIKLYKKADVLKELDRINREGSTG